MALRRLEYDDAAGGYVSLQDNPYFDETFTATAAQTTFSLATDINASQTIDLWLNGLRVFEGGANDWTRNDGSNQIIFNDGLPLSTRVDVRIWDR